MGFCAKGSVGARALGGLGLSSDMIYLTVVFFFREEPEEYFKFARVLQTVNLFYTFKYNNIAFYKLVGAGVGESHGFVFPT